MHVAVPSSARHHSPCPGGGRRGYLWNQGTGRLAPGKCAALEGQMGCAQLVNHAGMGNFDVSCLRRVFMGVEDSDVGINGRS